MTLTNPVPLTDAVREDGMEHFADHALSAQANNGTVEAEIERGLFPRAPDMRAYIVLYPRARVHTLLLLVFWPITFEVSAFFFLFYWLAIQLLSGTAALLGPEQVGGIACTRRSVRSPG